MNCKWALSASTVDNRQGCHGSVTAANAFTARRGFVVVWSGGGGGLDLSRYSGRLTLLGRH